MTSPESQNTNYSKAQLVLEQLRDKTRFRVTDALQDTPVCIEVFQKNKIFKIGTLGNILLVQAKGKAGKTYFTSALTASLLSNKEYVGFRGFLPEEKSKVIYFDTEQGQEDARTVQNRIYKMAGLPVDQEYLNLEYYCLRALTAPERCDLIEFIIYHSQNIGAIIIDGVRDLINDFNDTKDSFIMINKLMKWTEEKKVHIITILHQNPNDDKARGHLGTELTNKAEFIISIGRNKADDSYRTLEGYGRRKSFTPFNYTLNEDEFPILSNEEKPLGKINPLTLEPDIHKNIVKTIFEKQSAGTVFSFNKFWPLLQTTFRNYSGRYNFSDKQCRDLVKFYIEEKFLKDSGIGKMMVLSLP
jgi:hypothetical protein